MLITELLRASCVETGRDTSVSGMRRSESCCESVVKALHLQHYLTALNPRRFSEGTGLAGPEWLMAIKTSTYIDRLLRPV